MMRYTAEQRFQTEIQKSRTAGKSVVAPSEFASFVNRGRNISARGVSKVSTDDDVRDEMRGKFKDAFGAVAEWKTIDAMNLDGTILTHLSAREFEAYATRRAAQLQNRSTSSSLFLRTTRTFSTTYGRDSTLGTHYQELGVDAIDAGCGARLRYCIRNFLLYSPWPLYVNIGAQVAGNLYTRFRTQNYEDYFYT
eukprot:g3843.t1